MSYRCGCGICRDGFTIETVELGRLEKKSDAEMFLKEKYYDELHRDRIYFYDDPNSECRMFFNRNSNEFTNDIRGFKVEGFMVTADFINEYDDDMETDTEEIPCMSHAMAQKLRDEYYNYGADAVGIDEYEIRIDVFWNVDEFSKYVPEQKNQYSDMIRVFSFLKKLNAEQIEEISVGFLDGLTEDQIVIYAKPEFNYLQMNQIRKGLENGLTEEQISTYAKPEFNYLQMNQIRKGLEEGLNPVQISTYAKPEFDYKQMNQIRIGLEEGLNPVQIAIYAKPEFEYKQMNQIRKGFKNGLTEDQIAIYALSEYDSKVMEEIRSFYENDMTEKKMLSEESVSEEQEDYDDLSL